LIREPALTSQPLVVRERPFLPRPAVSDPALVPFHNARDGRLVHLELLGHPALRMAFELDPLKDQPIAIGWRPGLASCCGRREGDRGGGHGAFLSCEW